MGGIEAAKLFRFMYPDKKEIPIIMLTANATTEAIEESKDANFDAYLIKPVEPELLLNTISLLTNKKTGATKLKKYDFPKVININKAKNNTILDIDSLESLFAMAKTEDFMRNLIDVYLYDTKNNITKLIASVTNNKFQETTELAHALDGSSRSIGAKKLSAFANKIYKQAQSGNSDILPELVSELSKIFEMTKNALEKAL